MAWPAGRLVSAPQLPARRASMLTCPAVAAGSSPSPHVVGVCPLLCQTCAWLGPHPLARTVGGRLLLVRALQSKQKLLGKMFSVTDLGIRV